LILVVGCGVVSLLAALLLLSLCTVSIVGNNLQAKTDAIALQAGAALNADDHVGQINDLISRCRLLVTTSRQGYDASGSGAKRHLLPLAGMLLDQSRHSANLMESERKKLLALKLAQVKQIVKEESEHPSLFPTLPWVTVGPPSVEKLDVGSVRELSSNAKAERTDFYNSDVHQGYVDKLSDLYRGNINAKLVGNDKDLSFVISTLPAAVNNIVAPASLIAADRFVPLASIYGEGKTVSGSCAQIPSAVQLRLSCHVFDQLTQQECIIERIATSCTSGAQPAK